MFKNIYKGKKVLITGNTGFKGSWLTTWLLELGADIMGISDRIVTNPSLFETLALNEKIDYRQFDIRDKQQVIKTITDFKPNYIFHLAAQPIVGISYTQPAETFEVNVLGSINVLEAAKQLKNSCYVIMITSDKCYENVEWVWGYREHDRLGGKDPYSASKAAAEIAIYSWYHSFFSEPDHPVRVVSVRAGNVIGGGDWAEKRIVPDSMKAWSVNHPVEIRRPHATRPWQHVLEPLSGYLRVGQALATNKAISGQSFNFGPNADQDHTVLELLHKIGEVWFGQNLNNKVKINNENSFHEAGLLKLNCDKALNLLQWKPTLQFDQTSFFTANWYLKYYKEENADMFRYTLEQITEYQKEAINIQNAWAND